MAEFVTGFQTPEGKKLYDYNSLANKPNSFSGALKGLVSGGTVRADDVSPIIHQVACKVKSKNLFDTQANYKNGEYTYENGTLTLSVRYIHKFIELEAGRTYTFSCKSIRTGTTGGGVHIRAYTKDQKTYMDLPGGSLISILSPTVTVTMPAGYPVIRLAFYGHSLETDTGTSTYSEIMLEEGSKATGYVPYVNPSIATITRCGKNLIPHPYINQGASANGGTITVQADGGITFSGTPTGYVGVSIYNGPALATSGTVAFSVGGNARNVVGILYMYDANGETVATKSTTSVIELDLDTFPTVTRWNITFSRAISDESMSGVAYPQIEVGSAQTEFELFKGSEVYTPNDGGEIEGVLSIAPTMTFLTDTENTVIEIEYQRDIDKAIKDIERLVSPARIVNIDLLASAWVGTTSPYSQVVTVAGATKYSQVNLTPSVEQLAIFYNKDLAFVTENENGVVTVYAIGQKPQNDYTMQATVMEVNV